MSTCDVTDVYYIKLDILNYFISIIQVVFLLPPYIVQVYFISVGIFYASVQFM